AGVVSEHSVTGVNAPGRVRGDATGVGAPGRVRGLGHGRGGDINDRSYTNSDNGELLARYNDGRRRAMT
uniref:Uncharacterized protein n=1 Tax=Triticum urartu TaxID=4572 RepID=A0A8R7PAP9_TRIUA